jgi:hypothetical protein
MTAKLRYFWFKSEQFEHGLGYGVTAWTEDDAVALLRQKVFAGAAIPVEITMAADIDLAHLDKHVTPNMEAPTWRGVWFPRGYAD